MQQQKQQLFIIFSVILFSSLIRAFFRNKRAANWQTPAKASKIQHHHITTQMWSPKVWATIPLPHYSAGVHEVHGHRIELQCPKQSVLKQNSVAKAAKTTACQD